MATRIGNVAIEVLEAQGAAVSVVREANGHDGERTSIDETPTPASAQWLSKMRILMCYGGGSMPKGGIWVTAMSVVALMSAQNARRRCAREDGIIFVNDETERRVEMDDCGYGVLAPASCMRVPTRCRAMADGLVRAPPLQKFAQRNNATHFCVVALRWCVVPLRCVCAAQRESIRTVPVTLIARNCKLAGGITVPVTLIGHAL